mmetsp:Transcript_20995/g.70021  ORF Transcript_20995/g.70021 Transcript_20995/m.70021 type:complete len:204 (+) Transcript_20995:2269-2880(+)
MSDALVISLDRIDILLVLFNTLYHGLFSVVGPVNKASQDLGVIGRRVEFHVIDLSSDRISPPADTSLDQDVVWHVEQHELVGLDPRLLHSISLHSSAGKTIKKPSLVLAILLSKPVLDNADNHVIGNQSSFVHESLRHLSQLGSSLHLSTESIPRRDVHNSELLDDVFALGSFARRWGTRDDDPWCSHGQSARTASPQTKTLG